MNDFEQLVDKYNKLDSVISDNKHNHNNILNNLKNDLDCINSYKNLVNKSKSLMIKINKSNNFINNKKKLEHKFNSKIKSLNIHNPIILPFLINNYKSYLNINYDLLNQKLEHIISNSSHFNFIDFYHSINLKKSNNNNLQKLIYSIKFNNNYFLPKIIFLENFDSLENSNSILSFIKKFNFIFINKYTKTLKRGFISFISHENSNFILKFQPNKSFMEIIINKYLSKYNYLHNLILFPKYFFVNKNNSYFYIIPKYDYDLFNFIKNKNKHISDSQIIFILQSLIKTIYFLHNINIIYADIKLENFVVNVDNNNIITDIKLIDFDVSLFDKLPNEFNDFDPKIINLLNNKKPRGTKYYMSKNSIMHKSNDIYSIGTFIIILLYKNILKILLENKSSLNINLYSKIINRLHLYKNKLDDDSFKLKLIKFILRIYTDKRFKKYWTHNISFKTIYFTVKNCINQSVSISDIYNDFCF